MIDIVNRLRFDAIRCEANFSRGVASNIDAGADEIERLRAIVRVNGLRWGNTHAEIDAMLAESNGDRIMAGLRRTVFAR